MTIVLGPPVVIAYVIISYLVVLGIILYGLSEPGVNPTPKQCLVIFAIIVFAPFMLIAGIGAYIGHLIMKWAEMV